MAAYEEKKKLLLEMIAYVLVDGQLSKKDYDFLFSIANQLNLEKGSFIDLLNEELPDLSDSTELTRIQQFYRLIVFFQEEGLLYKHEPNMVFQIGISMGLNIEIAKQILKRVQNSPNSIITDETLIKIYWDETIY